jgi:hypothetical protein
MEKITEWVGQNPGMLGLFVAAIGALIMVGAILKWKWIVGTDHTGNTVRTGLLGWLVYKLFGRRVFFILTGLVILAGGIVWFFAMRAMGLN